MKNGRVKGPRKKSKGCLGGDHLEKRQQFGDGNWKRGKGGLARKKTESLNRPSAKVKRKSKKSRSILPG